MNNIINNVKQILESSNYITRVKSYSELYDVVAYKNKESYLIKIVTDANLNDFDKSELVNLAKTNGCIPILLQFDTNCNRITSVINVLNGLYSTMLYC